MSKLAVPQVWPVSDHVKGTTNECNNIQNIKIDLNYSFSRIEDFLAEIINLKSI